MTLATKLKLGQIAGALLMAAGVTACSLHSVHFPAFFILGALLYAGCRIVAWIKDKP